MRIQSLLGAAAVAGMMLVGVPAMAQTDPMAAPAADPAMAQPMMKKPMMKRHMSHRSMMMHHRKMMMHHKHKMMMHIECAPSCS